ncbi:MAG: hypothetical protein ACTSQH_02035 [Candidatus Hodarchaeales archaeon]
MVFQKDIQDIKDGKLEIITKYGKKILLNFEIGYFTLPEVKTMEQTKSYLNSKEFLLVYIGENEESSETKKRFVLPRESISHFGFYENEEYLLPPGSP